MFPSFLPLFPGDIFEVVRVVLEALTFCLMRKRCGKLGLLCRILKTARLEHVGRFSLPRCVRMAFRSFQAVVTLAVCLGFLLF